MRRSAALESTPDEPLTPVPEAAAAPRTDPDRNRTTGTPRCPRCRPHRVPRLPRQCPGRHRSRRSRDGAVGRHVVIAGRCARLRLAPDVERSRPRRPHPGRTPVSPGCWRASPRPRCPSEPVAAVLAAAATARCGSSLPGAVAAGRAAAAGPLAASRAERHAVPRVARPVPESGRRDVLARPASAAVRADAPRAARPGVRCAATRRGHPDRHARRARRGDPRGAARPASLCAGRDCDPDHGRDRGRGRGRGPAPGTGRDHAQRGRAPGPRARAPACRRTASARGARTLRRAARTAAR